MNVHVPPRQVITGATGDSMACDGSKGNYFICQAQNDEMAFTCTNLSPGWLYVFEARQGAAPMGAGITLVGATGVLTSTFNQTLDVGISNPACIISAVAVSPTTLDIISVQGPVTQGRVVRGTATLINGTATISASPFSADATIIVTMRDPGAGAITAMAALDVPVATRDHATGQFVVNCINDVKAVIATAVCTFDWAIIDMS